MKEKTQTPIPTKTVSALSAYAVPRAKPPMDLYLDANESPCLKGLEDLQAAEITPEVIRRYPDKSGLEAKAGRRYGATPEQTLITAGGDDAIDRACRAYLGPGREMILPWPGFSMFKTFAGLSGGTVKTVPWVSEKFPTEDVLKAVKPNTGIIVLVSPNNPTGLPITETTLREISAKAAHALVILDLAYAEFADEDLSKVAMELPNVLMIRTLSKGWAMAGLRIGAAVGPKPIIDQLRAAGPPFSVSSLSIAFANAWLEHGEEAVLGSIREIKSERDELYKLLKELNTSPFPSQGNFVFTQVPNPKWVRDAMAGMGIAVRLIAQEPYFQGGVRITCPGNTTWFDRLSRALKTVFAPELIFCEFPDQLPEGTGSFEIVSFETESIDKDLEQNQSKTGWVIGSTVESIKAARRFGLLPIGITTNEEESAALTKAGAGRVIENIKDLEGLLP